MTITVKTELSKGDQAIASYVSAKVTAPTSARSRPNATNDAIAQ